MLHVIAFCCNTLLIQTVRRINNPNVFLWFGILAYHYILMPPK